MATPQHIYQLLDTNNWRIKSPNNVKISRPYNYESHLNKNHYSESEHSDDENE